MQAETNSANKRRRSNIKPSTKQPESTMGAKAPKQIRTTEVSKHEPKDGRQLAFGLRMPWSLLGSGTSSVLAEEESTNLM